MFSFPVCGPWLCGGQELETGASEARLRHPHPYPQEVPGTLGSHKVLGGSTGMAPSKPEQGHREVQESRNLRWRGGEGRQMRDEAGSGVLLLAEPSRLALAVLALEARRLGCRPYSAGWQAALPLSLCPGGCQGTSVAPCGARAEPVKRPAQQRPAVSPCKRLL